MKIAICAIVKNEHRYLEEWTQYNLDVGFDEVWIGEDYTSDSHKSITDKFDSNKVHLVKVEDYLPKDNNRNKCSDQIQYYDAFLQKHRNDFDWIAFFDIDEFLVLEKESLKDFLNDYKDYEGVVLAWKYYTASGKLTPPEEGVVKGYTIVDTQLHGDCQVKTIVNTHIIDKVIYMHSSNYNCVNVFKEYDFKKHLQGCKYAQPKYWHRAWINHYFTKSWQEWVERMIRGNMQNNFRTLDTFFDYNPDMKHLQEKLTLEAVKIADTFNSTRIYSRKYSFYNKNYLKELKNKFIKKYTNL